MKHAALVAAALMALMGLAMAAPVAQPTVSVYHWDSVPMEGAFLETFLLTDVHGLPEEPSRWSWTLDGVPLDVSGNGPMHAGTYISFEAPVFDFPRTLVAQVDGAVVLEHRFGGGAGTPWMAPS